MLARAIARRGGEATIFASAFGHATGRLERIEGRGLSRDERFAGVRFVWLRTFPYRGNTWRRMVNMASYALLVVLAQIGRPRPTVVIGSTVHPFAALAGWLVARLRGARYFYDVRDLWPETLIAIGALDADSPGARGLSAIEAFLVRRAEYVTTVLPGMADYLTAHGLPSDHVRYLPNGVDFAALALADEQATSTEADDLDALLTVLEGRRAAGATVFGYVGAHGIVNRLDLILEGLQRARSRSDLPIVLVLLGDGPEKPGIRRRALELGLDDVMFADPVSKRRVPSFLAALDFGVVHETASGVHRYGVSFNKLFDYMGARIPVAFGCATDYDLVAAAGAGRTFTPGDPDAIAEAFVALAATTPEERRRMGADGRAFVEREHDLEVIGDRFADLVGCADADA
jgi:glycosyltransferase involved in cell wall biosynthesis